MFGAGVGAVMGVEPAEQFFAGYLLEQSLSIDNLFVFILVFRYPPLLSLFNVAPAATPAPPSCAGVELDSVGAVFSTGTSKQTPRGKRRCWAMASAEQR